MLCAAGVIMVAQVILILVNHDRTANDRVSPMELQVNLCYCLIDVPSGVGSKIPQVSCMTAMPHVVRVVVPSQCITPSGQISKLMDVDSMSPLAGWKSMNVQKDFNFITSLSLEVDVSRYRSLISGQLAVVDHMTDSV